MIRKKVCCCHISLARLFWITLSLLSVRDLSAQGSCTLPPADLQPGCTPPIHLGAPQRTLAENCSAGLSAGPAGVKYCQGYPRILTGSGGAEVTAYFTGTSD